MNKEITMYESFETSGFISLLIDQDAVVSEDKLTKLVYLARKQFDQVISELTGGESYHISVEARSVLSRVLPGSFVGLEYYAEGSFKLTDYVPGEKGDRDYPGAKPFFGDYKEESDIDQTIHQAFSEGLAELCKTELPDMLGRISMKTDTISCTALDSIMEDLAYSMSAEQDAALEKKAEWQRKIDREGL